jgi:hypothetical protein
MGSDSMASLADAQFAHSLDFSHTAKTVLYTENSKQIFPEMKLRGLSPNSYIHVSVSDLYITTIGLPILLQEDSWTNRWNI